MSKIDFLPQMAKGLPDQTVAAAAAKCKSPVIEPKLDGWRGLVYVDESGAVRIFKPSRHKDKASIEYTAQVPELVAAMGNLPADTILDGEIVAQSFDAEEGIWVNDFHLVQTAMASDINGKKAIAQKAARLQLQFVAFDVLRIGGTQVSSRPLRERREVLQSTLEAYSISTSWVQLIIQLPATQQDHDDLVALGMEGSVIKDLDAPYAFAKRGHGFFKIKTTRTIDCVVMDVLQDGKGQHVGLAGRMVVGQWRDGELVEVAKVNCLNNQHRAEATHQPERFVGQVLEVKIYGWIDGDAPRHPTPLRFREDKPADACLWAQAEGA